MKLKVRYEGPRQGIVVGAYGLHRKDEVRKYPEEVARELVESSSRQVFLPVGRWSAKPVETREPEKTEESPPEEGGGSVDVTDDRNG